MSDTYTVENKLNRDTVTKLLSEAKSALQGGQWEIDLSQVTEVDTCSLAFWVALERAARLQQAELSWKGVPEQMKSIADLVGLKDQII